MINQNIYKMYNYQVLKTQHFISKTSTRLYSYLMIEKKTNLPNYVLIFQ